MRHGTEPQPLAEGLVAQRLARSVGVPGPVLDPPVREQAGERLVTAPRRSVPRLALACETLGRRTRACAATPSHIHSTMLGRTGLCSSRAPT